MTSHSGPKDVGVNRTVLARGDVMALARQRDGKDSAILSDEALLASRRAFIPDAWDKDIWVFGYGSLIWNPVVQFSQTLDATIYGYHRRFCMWTRIGRGSPDCPGLVLALDKGGSTKGVIFRLERKIAIRELDILWRREMMADSYRPVWLSAHSANGPIKAMSFAMRRDRPIYAPPMAEEEVAKAIYHAKGFVGPCRDYLENTYQALVEAGIHDKQMSRLVQLMLKMDQKA